MTTPGDRGNRSALRVAAPYLALIVVVLVVYADPLFTRRTFFYRDLGTYMRPVLAEASNAGGHSEFIPKWTHAISNGRPLIANAGYSLLEPLTALYRVLPFDLAFNLFLILHVMIAGCSMLFLARRLGCSSVAAFGAGAAYALGGGIVSALDLYWTVVAAAWAPLVVAAGVAAVAKPTARGVALLALPIGLQAVGGQPEFILATIILGIAISFVRDSRSSGRRVLVTLGIWVGGIVGGFALAAPQLIPAARHARSTLRALGFTAEGILFNSLHPLRTLWLFIPGLGGNPIDALKPDGFPGAALLDGTTPYLLTIYLGIITVALAIIGVVLAHRRSGPRALASTFAILALLGVVAAYGRYVPGVSAVVAAFPFPVPLRFAEKALYLTFLAVPPLAALGIDRLRAFDHGKLSVLLAIAVVLDLGFAHLSYAPTIAVADLRTPPLARQLLDRSRALGISDGTWRIHHQRQSTIGGWGPPAGSIRPDEAEFYLWQVRMLFPPTGAPYGIREAMEPALDQLADLRYFAVIRTIYNGPRQAWARALGEAGVLWVISPEQDLSAATSGILSLDGTLGEAQGVPAGSGYLYRNTAFISRARLTTDVSIIPSPTLRDMTAMVQRRYDGTGSWPPTTIVEAEPGAVTATSGGDGGPGSVSSLVEDHSGLTLSVSADRSGLLVVSDVPGALRGWRAFVDGRPAPVRRANFAYMAVPVETGRHEIRLEYDPPGLRAGVFLLLIAGLGCAAALWPRFPVIRR